MRIVKQRHLLGCGPACLATITGLSYKRALDLIHPIRKQLTAEERRDPLTVNTPPCLLMAGIRSAGLRAKKTYGRSPDEFVRPTIVNIRWATGNFHWVVYDPKTRRYLDPAGIQLPQTTYQKAFDRGTKLVISFLD